MATMQAVRIHEYGGTDELKLETVPRPMPGPNEALIKVHAAGVNPVDAKARGGALRGFWDFKFPFIPGWDFSGIVEESGEGVTDLENGHPVYGYLGLNHEGAYAEYITAPVSIITSKPPSLSHAEAAAVPLAALTAWQSLFDTAGLSPGQKVLIHAAAGGVGSFAVQLAKWKGAYVIGTASKSNHALLEELGVDQIIDYNSVRFDKVVENVDVVFDTVGGDVQERSWKTLKPGGILVSITSDPSEARAKQLGLRCAWLLVQPSCSQLEELTQLIESGKLKVILDKTYPLSQAADAHNQIESGHTRGKIALTMV